jgi:glycosyltransferase involved in cell wall biosynthesis
MTKVLFIGTFLSKKTGTKSISEKLKEELELDNVKIFLVSSIKNKFLRLLHIVFAVLFVKYDIIHIDVFSGQAFKICKVASFIAKYKNKKILMTLHGGALPDFFEKSNQEQIIKVFKRASKIYSPSLYLIDFFNKNKISVDYLPNSINCEKFPFLPKKKLEYKLLWVRAFTQIYNPLLAIKLLYEVKKKYPLATLTMVGPDKGMLKDTIDCISSLQLKDSVFLTGALDNNKLYQYYQTHDVFINTTSFESFGVAVMEAASCGIPIISTNVGEIPFLFKDKQNILLVNSFDEVDFSKQIDELFQSSTLSNNLVLNAKILANKYDWKIISLMWYKILKKN